MGWYFFESILIISMKLLFLQLTYTSIRMKMHRCIHNTIHFDEFRRMEKEKQKKSQLSSSLFKLETEQLVFYKIVRDLVNGRWVVVVFIHFSFLNRSHDIAR